MILAIDTSTRNVSLALRGGHEILYETTWRSADHHTVELGPRLDEMLGRCGVAPADLKTVAVSTGPGSFTGLRIGMSAAKGLALAAGPDLKLVGVPTLDIVAEAAQHPAGIDWLCAAVQAGRGRLSAGMYRWQENRWLVDGTPFIITIEDLIKRLNAPTLVSGELDSAEHDVLIRRPNLLLAGFASALRRAGYLAEIAARRVVAGDWDDPATLAPTYIH